MHLESFKHVTCPAEPSSQNAIPLHGSLTFQHLIKYIAAACTVLTLILSISLIVSHLRCYTIPREQKQIIRIVFTPFVFALTGLVCILSYNAATYLMPIALLYEAFSLASIFLLFVYSMVRDHGSVQQFFAAQDEKTLRGTLRGFCKTWTIVFIYPVAYAILVIAEEISQATGRYCAVSLSPRFGHIWIQVLEVITVAMAVTAVLKFFKLYKSHFTVFKPMGKFLSFKVIVFVNVLQTFVFNILRSRVHGGSKITYKDITVGIPAVLLTIEQLIFAAILLVTFRAKEYNQESLAKIGLPSAVADALNPADLIVSIVRAFQYLCGRKTIVEP